MCETAPGLEDLDGLYGPVVSKRRDDAFMIFWRSFENEPGRGHLAADEDFARDQIAKTAVQVLGGWGEAKHRQ